MADRIKLLPDSVANQIAAGEVVNRPSSVVKELMENAVDAGSKSITVNFRDGGKELIQVVDDGCGMSPIDARMAFDRHATSKINQVNDIYSISTFGFRGEALASIASVAEVELRTRQEGEELGVKIEISGGKFVNQTPISTTVGSQFLIKNLFYNVPARRRFLQRSTTEARHITAEYQRVALCNPEIEFSLYDSDALVSKLPPAGLRQRIVGIIGKNISRYLLELNADTSIVKVDGYVGRPEGAKQNNKEQFLFVNGRYFKSPYFHRAVIAAYEKLIQPNTQPSYFLYLTIEPDQIDINVHPQKTEVKFSDGSDIWQIINAAVRESLAKSGAVPAMDFDMDTSVEIPVFKESTVYKPPQIRGNPDFNPFDAQRTTPKGMQTGGSGYSTLGSNKMMSDPIGVDSFDADFIVSDDDDYQRSALEFISGEQSEQGVLEIDNTTVCGDILTINQNYFATSIDGTLVVVDIRRAYESVLYDRYVTMLSNRSSASQQLLFPETVTMSLDDITLLKSNIDDFIAFGFDIKVSDKHTIEVLGLPADFTSVSIEELIYELLDAIRQEGDSGKELRRRRLAETMSKLGSSSKMRRMKPEELVSLMEQLSACNNPSYTPSGNAVMSAISNEEIKKRLK